LDSTAKLIIHFSFLSIHKYFYGMGLKGHLASIQTQAYAIMAWILDIWNYSISY